MISKPYFELTEADLRDHPIWVLAIDAASYGGIDEDPDDETGLVVPLPADPAVSGEILRNCLCYVRATFLAGDGRRYSGLMCSGNGDGVDDAEPAIITGDGQVDFYLGMAGLNVPNASRIAGEYARLGTTPGGLFPLRYEPDVPVPGGSSGGVIEGFTYLVLDRGVSTIHTTT